MEGLEKIIEQIEVDAKTSAQKIIEKAQLDAEKIMKQAEQEAMQQCTDINKQAELEISTRRKKMESQAILQKRQMILAAKQEIITDIIEKTREYFNMLPEEEYFKIIVSMVSDYALPRQGKILLSANDLARIPEQFQESIVHAISNLEGAVLEISREPAAIESGFILQYGAIEINCAFHDLIFAAKDTIQDKLHALLFETQ